MKILTTIARRVLFVCYPGFVANAGAATLPPDLTLQTFRMNLGGESGNYTDWEMAGLTGLHELRAKISVTKIYGKPRDKWAALVRLALLGPGSDTERKQCSLLLIHNRKDKTRSVVYEYGEERITIEFKLPRDGKVELGMKRVAPNEIRIQNGDRFIDVPCNIDIVGVKALGSGVDVTFDPLTVTSRAP